ncbi:MAG TPA: hypothetical protein VMJ31_07650 [Methylocystis sp.]|nr:hypothetical protein [Methylocystis sp.]
MFNAFSLKLVTILFAATAVMAGYPCAASAYSEPQDGQIRAAE